MIRWIDKRDWHVGDACYCSTRPIGERQSDVFDQPKFIFGTVKVIWRAKDGYIAITYTSSDGIRSTVDSRHVGRGDNPNDPAGWPDAKDKANGKS